MDKLNVQKEAEQSSSGFSPTSPKIELPKGGGAIRGIGEKFAANPVTGTGSMSVPIATSPGRSGFGPQLSISYDSGAGNGPFGFGWNISIPAITRKTDKGLPQYRDEDESDVFILSGSEDLVPMLEDQSGAWVSDTVPDRVIDAITYKICRYRPRIEGLFARIERWSNIDDPSDVHWRTISKDNILTLYGNNADSRILDPEDSSRIFSWLISETRDDKGNAVLYRYKAENGAGVDSTQVNERNRGDSNAPSRTANRYLKRIYYGNRTSLLDNTGERPPFLNKPQIDTQIANNEWMFEAVFDYGEHDLNIPRPNETGTWGYRTDPFSSYRSGFEVRTTRLCQRVLMFHHFDGEAGVGNDCLVRSTDFTYSAEKNRIYTFLNSVTQVGYKRNNNGYDKRSMPPVEYEYTQPVVQEEVHNVDPESLENLPIGVDGSTYQWVDLHGEGIPGILTEQAGSWFYKRNLSPASKRPVEFSPLESVTTKPNLSLADNAQFMDLAGDGQPDLVVMDGPMPGLYEHDQEEGWDSFLPFTSHLNRDMRDPNLKFVDLDGDGHADVMITEDNAFIWHASLAEQGFAPARRVTQVLDEEKGPRLVFADSTQSIFLSDMSGDGLTDLVRIRSGEVCYWPNLGYCHFGAKITMDSAPLFDNSDQFDNKRIRLADIDGSGTTDIIYLHREGVRLYFNQSGNSWSDPQILQSFPRVDDMVSIDTTDLLGNGTACLVWSSPLPGNTQHQMRYINLMGENKPHLLFKTINNLGAETRVHYVPSTKFYLQDKRAGNPWLTKLPFPVHVVERVETFDHISRNHFVTRYAYHHGYFDGKEREFRGFGMVEQWDSEQFSVLSNSETFPQGDNVEAESHVPPVHTKTWFHTGIYLERQNITQHYSNEYYSADPEAVLLPDTILQSNLSTQEQREACRALKGSILRQEVYALDGSPQSHHPYSVSEQNYELKRLQPVESNRHVVFFAHDRQSLTYHYERNPADPRISHALTLAVDDFGNVTKATAIVYPRRTPAYDEQARLLCTYSQSDFIHLADEENFYLIGVPYQSRSYEITGLNLNNAISSLQDIRTAIDTSTEINYEQQATEGVLQKRLIEREQIVYYRNDLSGPLPNGEVESLALPYESYLMAFTPELLQQVYTDKIDYNMLSTILIDEGGFVSREGVWWDPSGYQVFDPAKFYQPVRSVDPFENEFKAYYDDYALLIRRTEDSLENIEIAENDYRVLQPWMETDINQNRSAVQFDELGMIVSTAEMGKENLNEGDTLADPTTRLEYELFNWMQNQKPNYVHTLAREKHQDNNSRWQETYVYSDGLGHEVSTKVQAEPGMAPARDNEGHLLHDTDGSLIFADTSPNVRWVGSGRKVFNNKGHPVKQYEPFFSNSHEYEEETQLVEWGVTPILHYDPLGRLIRTVNPNGTYSKVEFGPWQQRSFDENDTVTDSDWYAERIDLPPSDPQHRAAELSAEHNNTPAIAHLDTLGRNFLMISDNGADGQYTTHTELDIEGNPRVITDARGNPVMQYAYNMIGPSDEDEEEEEEQGEESEEDKLNDHLIYQSSMDAGERWMLYNVVGNPIRSWDSRNHVFSYEYDALQRQTHFYVQTENELKILAEQIVYGESIIDPDPDQDPAALNLRGQVYQQYDGAGVVTNKHFDFKDNLLESNRKLAIDYKKIPDWSQSPPLEDETFTMLTSYDALNRPVEITSPDKSIYRPTYNEANLLNAVKVNLRGAATQAAFVTNIDYDAKGQREEIEYANGAVTKYKYDPLTFRLVWLNTVSTSNNHILQDITYTYDPVGNIMEIHDDAQQTKFFKNSKIEPHNRYEYDALYRLIKADGREHAGQEASNQRDQKDFNYMNIPNTNDGQAMRNYSEEFNYDEVGNIMSMVHRLGRLSNPSPGQEVWNRRYQYATANNRLLSTSRKGDADVPNYSDTEKYSDVYGYDDHGNMTSMPHLTLMQWDYDDQLQATARQAVNNGSEPEATWYTYDADGQRVRKATEHQPAGNETLTRFKERIYLGGYEIFREYKSDGSSIKMERQTLHIMDDEQRIAMVETKVPDMNSPSSTSITRYQIDNHLGSSSLELDEINGSIISYEEYYPYGNTSYHAAKSGVEVSQKRYRYTGKEKDDETGLYYNEARYYASWLGRWVSTDPVNSKADKRPYIYANLKNSESGIEQTLDVGVYVYAHNDPVNLKDPNGLDPPESKKKVKDTDIVLFGRLSLSGAAFSTGVSLTSVVQQAGSQNSIQTISWLFEKLTLNAGSRLNLLRYAKLSLKTNSRIDSLTNKVENYLADKRIRALTREQSMSSRSSRVVKAVRGGAKSVARPMLAVGIITAFRNILVSAHPVVTTTKEAAGMAGAWISAKLFGAACTPFHPLAGLACGVVGGVLGYFGGSYLGKSVGRAIEKPVIKTANAVARPVRRTIKRVDRKATSWYNRMEQSIRKWLLDRSGRRYGRR